MRRMLLVVVTIVASGQFLLAQSVPVPSPFPGAAAPPPSTPRTAPPTTQKPAAPAAPASTPAAAPAVVSTPLPAAAATPAAPMLPGVPLYPSAEFLDTVDAGQGQSYHLYGTTAAYAEIVAYYRTTLKSGGREIYRTPGTYQFDLGRYDDQRMAYPPSVVVKDYAEGAEGGYLFVSGTTEKRFRTIIQIVPPAAGR